MVEVPSTCTSPGVDEVASGIAGVMACITPSFITVEVPSTRTSPRVDVVATVVKTGPGGPGICSTLIVPLESMLIPDPILITPSDEEEAINKLKVSVVTIFWPLIQRTPVELLLDIKFPPTYTFFHDLVEDPKL
jgi:hypothetical protein